MKAYICILAGGTGQRLWPLSTPEHPKQLIPFINNRSLLDETVQRLSAIAYDKEICVVANPLLTSAIKQKSYREITQYIEEPVGRNTAPAILLSCLKIHEKDQNSLIAFFPADHFIPEKTDFCSLVERALSYCQNTDTIVTLGLVPKSAATGYGYIQADTRGSSDACYPAMQFHEKPSLQRAQQYVAQNDMFWNAGMFLAKTSVLLDEFKAHAPALWQSMQQFLSGERAYADLEKISVDYAIMEKSKKITVFPVNFEWYDVGNIAVFLELQAKYQKNKPSVLSVAAHSNLVNTKKKTVAFVGVDNLCVVETENELLIVAKDKAERVKSIVESIEEDNAQKNCEA